MYAKIDLSGEGKIAPPILIVSDNLYRLNGSNNKGKDKKMLLQDQINTGNILCAAGVKYNPLQCYEISKLRFKVQSTDTRILEDLVIDIQGIDSKLTVNMKDYIQKTTVRYISPVLLVVGGVSFIMLIVGLYYFWKYQDTEEEGVQLEEYRYKDGVGTDDEEYEEEEQE